MKTKFKINHKETNSLMAVGVDHDTFQKYDKELDLIVDNATCTSEIFAAIVEQSTDPMEIAIKSHMFTKMWSGSKDETSLITI